MESQLHLNRQHFQEQFCLYKFFFFLRENRAKGGGICVANHTSPIDIIILGCDNCYAMVRMT